MCASRFPRTFVSETKKKVLTMKRLFRNWDVLRVIRLLAGAVFAGYGIYASDSLIIILGGLLMLMAVVNWSCCGAGGCGTSTGNKALYKDFVKPYRAENK